jgi:hypothetical protein
MTARLASALTLAVALVLGLAGQASAQEPADHGPGRSNSVGGTYLVRWPCEQHVVTVLVDTRRAPGSNAAAARAIRRELRWATAVSDVTYRYVGTTRTGTRFDDYGPADLVISWAAYRRGSELAYTHMSWTARRLVAGKITMNAGKLRPASLKARQVLRHELAHSMGLGHSHDPRDLMYPRKVDQLGLGHGDRVQLRRIARACS